MIDIKKPYLIGETAFHHEGDFEFLKKLIDEGFILEFDALKFHLLFNLDNYFVADHKAYKALSELMIKKEHWLEVHELMSSSDTDVIYLCNEIESLKWVNSLKTGSVAAIEIHATGINDIYLLKEACAFKGTVILGTGGSTIDEISFAIDILKKGGQKDILLMHGFQSYPTDYKDIVFSKMQLLEEVFKLPIGYADHTDPQDPANAFVSCIPQAMGFKVLEKHFTIAPGEKRVDSQSAVDNDQIKAIKTLMENISLSHGENPLHMSKAELKYGDTGPMKKAIVAKSDIKKGTTLNLEHLIFKRTNESIPVAQKDIGLFIGCETTEDIERDEAITFQKVKYHHSVSDFSQFKL